MPQPGIDKLRCIRLERVNLQEVCYLAPVSKGEAFQKVLIVRDFPSLDTSERRVVDVEPIRSPLEG